MPGLLIEMRPLLEDDLIHYAGQHLTIIAAENLETAIYAASLIKIEYESKNLSRILRPLPETLHFLNIYRE